MGITNILPFLEKFIDILIDKNIEEKEKIKILNNLLVDITIDIIRKSISTTKTKYFNHEDCHYISVDGGEVIIGFCIYLNSNFDLLDELITQITKISIKFSLDIETEYNLNSLIKNIRLFLISIYNLENYKNDDDHSKDELLNLVIEKLYTLLIHIVSIVDENIIDNEKVHEKANIILDRFDLNIDKKISIYRNEVSKGFIN